MKDTSKGGAVILWIGWILTAIAAGGPFVQFIFFVIVRVLRVEHLPSIVEFPLGIYLFLLYGFATPICFLIAVWFAIVAVKSGIPQRRKLVTLALMLLAGAFLLYQGSVVKHQW